MKDSKKRSKHWRADRFGLLLVGFALLAVLYQPFRVHAFSVNKAIQQEHAIKTPPAQIAKPHAQQVVHSKAEHSKAEHSKAGLVTANSWSDGDVISVLSDFYQSVIMYMGLLLAAVTVLAVATLRFLSKAAAEDMAHDSAKDAVRHYLETREFDAVVNDALQESGIASDLEQLAIQQEATLKEINQVKEDLKKLKDETEDKKGSDDGEDSKAEASVSQGDDGEEVIGTVDPESGNRKPDSP